MTNGAINPVLNIVKVIVEFVSYVLFLVYYLTIDAHRKKMENSLIATELGK